MTEAAIELSACEDVKPKSHKPNLLIDTNFDDYEIKAPVNAVSPIAEEEKEKKPESPMAGEKFENA